MRRLCLALLFAVLTLPAMNDTVSVTTSGNSYHKHRAPHLVGSKVWNGFCKRAVAAGYKPCKRCFKPKALKRSKLETFVTDTTKARI